jgi:3-isopropylmalate/(R)-2-methylmalate dehydratase small subunit
MEPIKRIRGKILPLPRADVDTDQIIPAKYLKRIERTGFGEFAFDEWRKDPSFVTNDHRYDGAEILVTGPNFGCGSSREHAPLAIRGAGVACVIAETYARIFYRNAINIGLPLVECPEAVDEAETGDILEVDTTEGFVVNTRTGKSYTAKPHAPYVQEIVNAGGLIEAVTERVRQRNATAGTAS